MNYKTTAGVLLFVLATSSQAQLYRTDSGVSGDSVGITGGGDMAWLQQFTVSGAFNQITGISTCFGTLVAPGAPGVTAGQAFRVFVWKGTPTGTGIDAPTLLATGNGSVAAGSIDTDVFQTVAVNATITGTTNFFIGASTVNTNGGFPAPLQTSGTGSFPILDKSWFAGSSTGAFDPNNLTAGVGLTKNSAVNLNGNWLIRANASAVPEPMTLTGFGLALGAFVARRRKKA